MSTKSLISLFGYKAWADSELFALLAKLPENMRNSSTRAH